MFSSSSHLRPGQRLWAGCGCVVPPGQGGTEPLHLAQVDEEGAVGTVHSVEGVARVRGPAGAHPLEGNHEQTLTSKISFARHQLKFSAGKYRFVYLLIFQSSSQQRIRHSSSLPSCLNIEEFYYKLKLFTVEQHLCFYVRTGGMYCPRSPELSN